MRYLFSKYCFVKRILQNVVIPLLAFFTKSKRLCLINVLVPRYHSDSCMKAKSCLPKGEHNDVNKGNLRYLIDFNFRRNVCNFICLDGVSNFCKHLFLRKESNLTFLDNTQILTNLVILCLMYFFTYCPGYWHFFACPGCKLDLLSQYILLILPIIPNSLITWKISILKIFSRDLKII